MDEQDLSDEILGTPRRAPGQVNGAQDGSISDLIVNGPDYSRLRLAVDMGVRTQPTYAARVLRMQARTGIPDDILPENLDEIEKMAQAADFDPEQFRKKSPLMARWLQKSPNRVAVMKEDAQTLQDLEQVYRRRDDPLRPRIPREIELHAQRLAELQAPDEFKEYQDALQRVKEGSPYAVDEFGRLAYVGNVEGAKTVEEAREMLYKLRLEELQSEERFIGAQGKADFGEVLSHKFRQNPVFAVPFLGALPEVADAIGLIDAAKHVQAGKGTELDMDRLTRVARMEAAAQARGQTTMGKIAELGSGLPAFILEMAATGGTSAVARVGAKKVLGSAAKGLTRKAVGKAAEIVTQAALVESMKAAAGVVRRQTPLGEAIIDSSGNFNYQITGDSGEPLFLSLTKETVGSLIGMATMHIPMGPLYNLIKKDAGEAVAKTFTDRLLNAGKEGIKGAFSGITINEATKFAKWIAQVGPDYEFPSGEDLLAQGVVFGGLGALHGIRARRAENTLRTIEGQRVMVDALKLANAHPKIVEEAIAAATKGTPEEFLYAPVEEIQRFFQSKGLDPREEMTRILGSPDAYDRALEAKHDLQIPTARYAMTIDRDPEASKFFQGKVKFDPMDASKDEIDATIKAAREAGAKKAAPAAAAAPTGEQQAAESALQVGRFIQARMKELGFAREAESFGKLYAERYKARAERRDLGETPLELFDKLGLGIFRKEGPAGEAPEGEASYVRVLEQGGRDRVERVPGATPAEAAQNASRKFPGSTIEPLTPEEARARVFFQPGEGEERSTVDGGPLYRQFKGNAAGAIEALKQTKAGEAVGALHHPDVGDIDLIWGKAGRNGYGLAKILDKHPEVAGDLQGFIAGLKVREQNPNSVILAGERGEAVVRLDWMKSAKRWLLTAYEKGKTPPPPDRTIDKAGPPGGERVDKTPPPAEGSKPTLPPDDFESDRKLYAGNPKAPRGSTEFGPNGIDINLFRTADRSTFLHESGHLWLDELITDATTAGVPEQLTKDLGTILKWLGAEAQVSEGGGAVRRALTVPQQEKWAAAIEAYFMEGKAPSTELRGVFYRFSEWLKRIYRSLVGLEEQSGQKLDISPEVREIMDRMLATDEQISQAKRDEGVESMLAGADWLPPAARAEIGKALGDVEREAKEELNRKLTAEVKKEESAQWARERAAVRQEVTQEVDQLPEQAALANLERGTKPDGSPLGVADLPPIKISRQAAIDAYGKEGLAGLPRRIFAADGMTPDEAAEFFGFSSGDELFTKFREMREPQTAEAREIRTKLEGLEMQRQVLVDQREPLQAEQEEAVKSLKAGRKTLANKLERAIRDEERAKIEPIERILEDIRDRGGIRPSTPTEDLPDAFRARKAGAGVGSDEIAQELADRGLFDLADSDALYAKLKEWQDQVKTSKERAAGAAKEARRLASERVAASIEALVQNATEQEQLRVQLARLTSEAAAFRREHHVRQRDALIDRLTDERMHERFPDLLTDGTLPEEAAKAVYNAQRAKLMARELELLAEHKLPTMKAMIRILAHRGGFSDLMRAEAERQIGQQKVREITPAVYKFATRVAERRAIEAMNKGDWKTAFDEKRLALLNHELYRTAERVRDQVDRMVDYMRRFQNDAVRARVGKAGHDYIDQIDAIMDRFEFGRMTIRDLEGRQSLRDWYREREREAVAGEGFLPSIPPRVLDEAFKLNYRELTFEELHDVHDAAKNIEHLAQLKNRLLASVDKREFNEARDGAVDSIEANSPGPRKQPLEPRLPGVELKKRGVEGFFASLRKMASLAREMDGFKDGGAVWDLIIRPANHAGNREASMQAEAAERFAKLMDEYTPAELLAMYRKEYIPGVGESLSRWGQIMVALNSGNEGNLQRVRDGFNWTDGHIKGIHDKLTEKDWKFVRGVWDLLERYWPDIRDLNKRVTGLEPDKVEARPFMTRFGEQPGGYFPIKYEPILSPLSAEQAQIEEAEPTLLGASIRATTRHGHREARMEHVERPVRLDPGVISDHLNQVIHDLTHFEFVVDTNRLLRDTKLQEAIVSHYGDQNFVQLKEWIKDIAVGNAPAKNAGERVLNWIRQGTVVARLAWNLKQFVTDQTGILQGAQRIGPQWAAKGWSQIAGDALRMENGITKISEKSEFMRNRWRTLMREINEAVGTLTQKGKVQLLLDMGLDVATGGRVDVQDIRNTYFTVLAGAQQLQDAPIWIGAYEKVLAEHKVESERSPADRERIEKLAIDLADQAVLDSFGGGQLKDLAQTQRGNAAWKVFTTFGSFANVTLQRNVEAWKRFSRDRSVAGAFRLAGDLALLNVVPAAITTAIGYALSNRTDDRRKITREFWADQAGQVFNQLPLGREFSPAFHGHDYTGPAGTEVIQTGSRLINSAVEAASKQDAKKIDWAAANQTAGSLFHYPATFVQRAANAIMAAEKKGAGEAIKAFLGGRPRK